LIPFEVKIVNEKIEGVILSDQIKSLDWKAREIEFLAKITFAQIDEVIRLV
jgi:mRNA interferase MazF